MSYDPATTCGQCGEAWDDHTLRSFREHHPANGLDLGYEEVPTPFAAPEGTFGNYAVGVLLRAGMIETDEMAVHAGLPRAVPVVDFQFVAGDGTTTVAHAALALPDTELRKLRTLVGQTIDGAIRAANTKDRELRRGGTT